MPYFQNILVGVDFAESAHLNASELGPVTREAIRHGIWLARLNGARLLFFSALETSDRVLYHLEEEDRAHVARTIEGQANQALAALVREAEQAGVKAQGKLVRGEGWLEITRQVLREGHDLVVVGTREASYLRRRLFGNTSLKLMRRCPCPVWVTRPGHGARTLRTLIATDLHPASESALTLGLALGTATVGPIHVLHVVEYPLDQLWSTGLEDAKTVEYHRKVRESAEQALGEQLSRVGRTGPIPAIAVHLVDGSGLPDLAIEHFIHAHQIDLLVMGTIARAGFRGIMIGNTAERLLPEVECSVVAVKPPGFQCPVTLE